jgi:hypothetical protein
VPMPAQQTIPASGLDVDLIQASVEEIAELIEEVEETSVEVNRVRARSERANEDDDCGGGLRSRMETFAFRVRRRRAVASPSPLEPPETMNVRSWIFMCARGIGEGEETARSDVRFSCGGQFTAGVQCLVKKSNQDGS